MPGHDRPELRLGPLLRHVGPTHATIWVETSAPCTVSVLGHDRPTFTVGGHHYALVVVRGLTPASTTPYDVRLDGERAWPLEPDPGVPATGFPASTIRTPGPAGPDEGGPEGPRRPLRIAFGSCRYASPPATSGGTFDPCALDALARDLAGTPSDRWPDLLLLLGDQVYADETTPGVQRRIRQRRGATAPRDQVADYEEYTWLYQESWSDPEVRWLYSVVPTAMIFDDHDVHDDWNTSRAWREEMQRTSWWQDRILGALSSYWVYQHLGNLSPDELDAEPTYARILAEPPGTDVEPLLRELAREADREADGAKGYRWSFTRDVGRTRVVVLDSRCGRMLDGAPRAMLSHAEFTWAAEQVRADVDHLLVATSLPWLLAPALHEIEAWDERLADDDRPRRAQLGERLRQAADLEHWAAFGKSFRWLGDLLADVAHRGDAATRPATLAVLSGDVHHSYAARVVGTGSPIYQLTCSPLHNTVPWFMRIGFRVAWSRAAERATRAVLGRLAKVPAPGIRWERTGGPFFGNSLGLLTIDGRRARLTLFTSRPQRGAEPGGPYLRPRHDQDLTPPAVGWSRDREDASRDAEEPPRLGGSSSPIGEDPTPIDGDPTLAAEERTHLAEGSPRDAG